MFEKYCGDEMKIDLMTGHVLAETNQNVLLNHYLGWLNKYNRSI